MHIIHHGDVTRRHGAAFPPPVNPIQYDSQNRRGWSDRLDLLSLRALGALDGGEFHSLVLLEAAVTVSLNDRVVDEDVTGSVVGGDETITLVRVEPFDCTLSHFLLFSY